jgi:adenosylcobinamide-GDP ribazoletransferase
MPAASVRAATAAVMFLTRVPLGRVAAVDGSDVARGAVLFPLVGAGIGAISGATALLLHPRLSSLLAAAVAVGVSTIVTGAIHLDALADTADAVGTSTRERALEVMRDPRIGSFGAAALVLDLLIKVAAVAQLLARGGGLGAFVAAGALSRAVAPVLAAVLPYPRVGGGPGSVLSKKVGAVSASVVVVIACVIAVTVARVSGVSMAAAVAVCTVVLGVAYARRLGGATGDMLGAATEVAETTALVVAAALA